LAAPARQEVVSGKALCRQLECVQAYAVTVKRKHKHNWVAWEALGQGGDTVRRDFDFIASNHAQRPVPPFARQRQTAY
jgi:hypothetical protein